MASQLADPTSWATFFNPLYDAPPQLIGIFLAIGFAAAGLQAEVDRTTHTYFIVKMALLRALKAQGIDPVLPLALERRYPLRPQFPS